MTLKHRKKILDSIHDVLEYTLLQVKRHVFVYFIFFVYFFFALHLLSLGLLAARTFLCHL